MHTGKVFPLLMVFLKNGEYRSDCNASTDTVKDLATAYALGSVN